MKLEQDMLRGTRVRLGSAEPEQFAKVSAMWARNSEYQRLLDSSIVLPWSIKSSQGWGKPTDKIFLLAIYRLEDERLIGGVDLGGYHDGRGNAYVGIGIGEPEMWSRGYGTEAMQLVLRLAFQELGLHRVSLNVFEYNPRAIRSYEKAGFRLEGRVRGHLLRDGQRWDLLYMSILRSEWLATQIAAV